MKKISIGPEETDYLDEVLFIDLLHLQQSNEDTRIVKGLLKKINKK